MYAELIRGTLRLEAGTRFTVEDAERMHELIGAFPPLSRVVVDFQKVREVSSAALVAAAAALATLGGAEVVVNGLDLLPSAGTAFAPRRVPLATT